MVNNVGAIDRRIDDRIFLERMDGGFHEKAHEAKSGAVLFLEPVLVLLAQVHDRLHIDLVERGQDGIGCLRLKETLGDALAQTRHRHPLYGTSFDHLVRVDRRGH